MVIKHSQFSDIVYTELQLGHGYLRSCDQDVWQGIGSMGNVNHVYVFILSSLVIQWWSYPQ
jgi:hypothetical protein